MVKETCLRPKPIRWTGRDILLWPRKVLTCLSWYISHQHVLAGSEFKLLAKTTGSTFCGLRTNNAKFRPAATTRSHLTVVVICSLWDKNGQTFTMFIHKLQHAVQSSLHQEAVLLDDQIFNQIKNIDRKIWKTLTCFVILKSFIIGERGTLLLVHKIWLHTAL